MRYLYVICGMQIKILSDILSSPMSERLSHNFHRELSLQPSRIDHEKNKQAVDKFIQLLPESNLYGGEAIPIKQLEDDVLLHVTGVGSVVAAASGNESTDVGDVWQSLVLGLDHYEIPLEESGLDRSLKTPFIHLNRWSDKFPHVREQVLRHLSDYLVVSQTDEAKKELVKYLDYQAPLGKLWSVIAIQDALARVNMLMQNKLLDTDGKVNAEYRNTVALVQGVSGTGEIQAHHDRQHGRIHNQTLTDLLENESVGFAAKMFGIGKTQTLVGACAASSKAVRYAEELSASRLNTVGLFIISSQYDGPTIETFNAFRSANIPYGDGLPYVYKYPLGYTEAPSASASIYMTAWFAKELRIDPTQLEYVRSETAQGSNRFGADSKLLKDLYQSGFTMLREVYDPSYDGIIVISTHGANTTGWVYEMQALQDVKQKFPNATVLITSSQPQMGHSYPNRQIISAELGSYSRKQGVLYGMARASEDLTLFGQEEHQELRRESINNYIPEYAVKNIPWTFGGETEREETKHKEKALRLLHKLAEQKIYIVFASIKVPDIFPHMVVHTGLNGEGGVNVFIPVEE